jgi:hypothetical protein
VAAVVVVVVGVVDCGCGVILDGKPCFTFIPGKGYGFHRRRKTSKPIGLHQTNNWERYKRK